MSRCLYEKLVASQMSPSIAFVNYISTLETSQELPPRNHLTCSGWLISTSTSSKASECLSSEALLESASVSFEAALEHGATVIISGSNMPKLERTRARLTAEYSDLPKDRIHLRDCNLADGPNQEANIKALLDAVTDGGKSKLNHIVHTAGGSLGILPVTEFTTEKWLQATTVRVLTGIFIAKFANQYLEWPADSSITFDVRSQRPQARAKVGDCGRVRRSY